MAVDTWEMVVVHRSFRREFREAAGLVGSVRAGDRARAELVGRHLAGMVIGLHHHHAGEDDLLWPVLLPRVTLHTELVHRMESQHKQLAVLIDRIEDLLPGWRLTGDAVAGRELAGVFVEASALLDEHLAQEEAEILPLVAEHVTPAEWQALGERGVDSLPKNSTVFVYLGLALQETTDDERRAFLGLLPPPVRLFWHVFGKGIYRRTYHRLYDTGARTA
ncbi:MAG TPA: hemerythrin domain-containing protein [Pseudonocardiaceae bacterium]